MRSCIHRIIAGDRPCQYEDWECDDGLCGPMCRRANLLCSMMERCPLDARRSMHARG